MNWMVVLQIVMTIWIFGTVIIWLMVVADLFDDETINWNDHEPPFFFRTPKHTLLCAIIWPLFVIWEICGLFRSGISKQAEPAKRALRRFKKNDWKAE